MRFVCILFCGLMVTAAFAQDAAKPNLGGKWKIDPARSDGLEGVTLSIQMKDDDTVHYLLQNQNGVTSEFDCATDGRTCDMMDSGHKAKVSLWYNGGTLVMMETRGNNVVKRKLSVTGATLNIEVVPIVPQGRTDKLAFIR